MAGTGKMNQDFREKTKSSREYPIQSYNEDDEEDDIYQELSGAEVKEIEYKTNNWVTAQARAPQGAYKKRGTHDVHPYESTRST